MTAAILLLVFLFVLGIGISSILYVCRKTREFTLMAGWALFAYICFAFVILISLLGVLS